MQQRYRVVSTDTHPEALKAIVTLREKFPTETFGIKRTHKGFQVYKRVTVTEASNTTAKKSAKQKGNKNGYSF